MDNYSRPTTRRPLGEATRRVNNSHHPAAQHKKSPKLPMPHHESMKSNGLLQNQPRMQDNSNGRDPGKVSPVGPNVGNPRVSAIKDYHPESNRNSQISTGSTESRAIKTHIGPWQLGTTLGKGATARVRRARHKYTGQEAAIKIMQKSTAQISQAGSLADLDRAEASQPNFDGLKRMPVGIEREVAIMKLIQHPHIMKLYDVWENRTEIYLVLELVDRGELFQHIIDSGRLVEEEAMLYFRQIISAIGYCHSFNICHRDLKPENILLNSQMDIKIADFGMAALHQAPDHKLNTSCGSPHYAAPELIVGKGYRGDLIDVWSIGVVFFAMIAGYLPFDIPGSTTLAPLMDLIKSGKYSMPIDISEEAKSLINRMLQVNPKNRISLSQIWKHPLVRKYDYLDDFSRGAYPMSSNPKDHGIKINGKNGIHKDLLRNLRSMWHMYSEQQLIDALLSDKPSEQKMFYCLLLKYRNSSLEDYNGDLAYSNSDYHHVKPLALTKAYSTCHFPQSQKGHRRQGSKFTVISNAAETEQSYDPFKASRPQHLNASRNDHAKITIHHSTDENSWAEDRSVLNTRNASSGLSVVGGDRSKLVPPLRNFATRSSMSSTRSRKSNGQIRASMSYKRGVSFTQIHKRTSETQRASSAPNASAAMYGRHSNHTEVTDDGGDFLRPVNNTPSSTRYIRSRKAQSIASPPLDSAVKPGRASQIFSEDVRQHSSSLAKDCDEAFNRISRAPNVNHEQALPDHKRNKRNPPASTNPQVSLDSRPLPPPPARSESIKHELLEARKQAELRKRFGGDDSPGYLDRMVNHIDRLIQPLSPTRPNHDRRINSAPTDARYHPPGRPLPSIHESRGEEPSPRRAGERAPFREHQYRVEEKHGRITSAPEAWNTTRHPDERYARPVALVKDTIRIVHPSSPMSPVRAPAPLTIRKKSSHGGPPMMAGGHGQENDTYANQHQSPKPDLRQQYKATSRTDNRPDLATISEFRDDGNQNDASTGTLVKKKSGWFKRNSRTEDEDIRLSIVSSNPTKPSSNHAVDPYDRPQNPVLRSASPEQPKKKAFSLGRIFKKRSRPDMSVSVNDIFEDEASVQDSIMDARHQTSGGRDPNEDARARQVAPQQSWLAKLFHVKPASVFLCFAISQRRARREITALLKDWKRYGIHGLQVNKERNIIFARVSAKNFLEMKEVAFACEIMTVIEHGKRNHLSIVRFTQEQGAASTFHKFVETLESVMRVRNFLVADERKKRMMIKTLNSAT
ncbi:serine/threonine-protein kinase GIN4 [Diplocarpon rosae]|nr:serine/threonine-protein kinase GIN4 [Diplocarpon rosae]